MKKKHFIENRTNPPDAYIVSHYFFLLFFSARYAVLRFNQYFKTKPAVMALEIPKWEDMTERTVIVMESKAFQMGVPHGQVLGGLIHLTENWFARSRFHKFFFSFLNTQRTFPDSTSSFSSNMFNFVYLLFSSTCLHQFVLWYFLFQGFRDISEWFAVQEWHFGSHKIHTGCSFCPAVALYLSCQTDEICCCLFL